MSEPDRPVAGVVLAAGTSSRMEAGFKLLLSWEEGTVVEASVRTALKAGLDPVVVVTGHRAGEVRRTLEERDPPPAGDLRIVVNPRFPEGQAASLARGVREVRTATAAPAAAVLLGDEPGIRTEVVCEVVEAWRRRASAASGREAGRDADDGSPGTVGERPVVRTLYRDRPGHPVVFPREAFADLERLDGDRGARRWLARNAERVVDARVDADAPADVDTHAEYRRADAGRGGRTG